MHVVKLLFLINFFFGLTKSSIVDDCDYANYEQLCGDVCIGVGASCTCGDGGNSNVAEFKYCCLDHNKTPGKQCEVDAEGNGYCYSGISKKMKHPCNNKCYNDYSVNNTSIGHYARFKCKTNDACVEVQNICHGVAQCPDKSDVDVCNSKIKCLNFRTGGFTKYDIQSTLINEHFECGYHDFDNDGRYDTLTRRDETNLNIVTQTGHINYTTLQNCTAHLDFRFPGLTCDDHGGCTPNFAWCRNDLKGSCDHHSFSVYDKTLCGNSTFWRTQDCNHYADNLVLSIGQRCTGSQQHCYHPWYLTVNFYYEVFLCTCY